jgi:2'-5' RNA ligase/phage head maturation protease
MIAFYLPQDAAQALAIRGGQPAEELHLTLAYLGNTSELNPAVKDMVNEAILNLLWQVSPLEGTISGVGLFNTAEQDETNAFYASFDSPALADLRSCLVQALEEAGVSPRSDHGFTPHVTLAYLPKKVGLPRVELPNEQIKFEQISFCWGEERIDYNLNLNGGFAVGVDYKKKVAAKAKATPPAGDGGHPVARPGAGASKKEGKGTAAAAVNLNLFPGGSNAITGASKNNKASAGIKFEFKSAGVDTLYNGVTGFFIEGWAAVSKPEDRYGDIIGPSSAVFKECLINYFELNPILLYEHGLDEVIGNKPLGQVTEYKFTDYGLWVKAFVMKPTWGPMLEIYNRIKAGILRTFSIGGIWDRMGNEIVEADLMEISVVATPAQPLAVFDLATKSFLGSASSQGLGGRSPVFTRNKSGAGAARDRKTILQGAALPIALAGLDYWSEQGKTLLAKPASPARDKAIKLVAMRINKTIGYIDRLLLHTH